jgi:hypothetical protein
MPCDIIRYVAIIEVIPTKPARIVKTQPNPSVSSSGCTAAIPAAESAQRVIFPDAEAVLGF